jgi:hypothetical protein
MGLQIKVKEDPNIAVKKEERGLALRNLTHNNIPLRLNNNHLLWNNKFVLTVLQWFALLIDPFHSNKNHNLNNVNQEV